MTINDFGCNLCFLKHMRDGSVGHSETHFRENIDVALGGHTTERLFGTVSEDSESDFEHATKYARKLLSGGLLGKDNIAVALEFSEDEHDWQRIHPKVNAILRERLDKTVTLLTDHKAELKAIADELVRKGTLFSDDVDSILHPAHTATERTAPIRSISTFATTGNSGFPCPPTIPRTARRSASVARRR